MSLPKQVTSDTGKFANVSRGHNHQMQSNMLYTSAQHANIGIHLIFLDIVPPYYNVVNFSDFEM